MTQLAGETLPSSGLVPFTDAASQLFQFGSPLHCGPFSGPGLGTTGQQDGGLGWAPASVGMAGWTHRDPCVLPSHCLWPTLGIRASGYSKIFLILHSPGILWQFCAHRECANIYCERYLADRWRERKRRGELNVCSFQLDTFISENTGKGFSGTERVTGRAGHLQ